MKYNAMSYKREKKISQLFTDNLPKRFWQKRKTEFKSNTDLSKICS